MQPEPIRHYTTAENEPLLDVICERLNRNNIFLANGSGPILKQCIPWLVSQRIKSSQNSPQNTRLEKFNHRKNRD